MSVSSCSLLLNEGGPCLGEEIPGYYNAGQERVGIYFNSDDTATALDIFYVMWSEKYNNNEELERALNNLCIKWEPFLFYTPNTQRDEEGIPLRISGLTVDKRNIRVWIGSEELSERKISRTAFFHEIVHIMLWRLNNEPDPDHEGDTYKGWTKDHTSLVEQMRKEATLEEI